jgi:hypothetical protein
MQRLGRSSPTLAVVDISSPGDYVVFRPKRISAGQRDRLRTKGDDPLADRAPWESVAWEAPWESAGWEGPDPDRLSVERPKGVELACTRCRHRPRKRLRDLYALAEQALAEGRAEVYL